MAESRRPYRQIALNAVLTLIGLLLGGSSDPANAGIRGPGNYSGVVIFDRWDTCLLISGPYVTYISGNVKNGLRDYARVAVQIEASDVIQPMNPGDALVRKYQLIGLALEPNGPLKLDGLDFRVKSDFGPEGSPKFVVEVINQGSGEVEIRSDQVGVTLLGNHKGPFSPSDGTSEAVITRTGLSAPSGVSRWKYGIESFHAGSKVEGQSVPDYFRLKAGESREFRIKFDLSPGEYQFIIGYGVGVHQGRSLISNAVSFDVGASGRAALAK
jgi:hypothetical protein